MEQLIPYLPTAIVVMLLIGVSVKLKDHPTFSDVTTKDTCDEKHKNIDDRLCKVEEHLDEIKKNTARIDRKLGQIEVLIKNNGKK